jgi:AP2-associated kinase
MQQPPPIGAFPPGTKLTVGSHSVTIKSYISEGGFAHVYVVFISPGSQEGDIACLKRVVVPDKIHLNLLRAEVDAMKRLKGHPNIVRYIDSHAARMANGQGYEVLLLMEYCSGNGLIDFMNSRLREQLTESEILKILSDITNGLACMHYLEPPLIHRDLKIENVLISGDGTYKLCDFGSVSPILRPPRNSSEFHILEDDIQRHTTAQYRAPEMVDIYRGFPIDEKCDIWALGVFLYKLCYYTTPFEREGQLAILHASYSFPSRPQYSDRLKRIVKATLAEDPRNRPNVYQVLKEVCSMRGTEVPIKDIYTTRDNISVKTAPAELKSTDSKGVPSAGPGGTEKPAVVQGVVKASTQSVQREIPTIQPMYRGRPQAINKKLVGTITDSPITSSPSKSAVFDDPFANLDKRANGDKRHIVAKTDTSSAPNLTLSESSSKPANIPEIVTSSYQDVAIRFPSVDELTEDFEKQRLKYSSDEDNPYAHPYEKPNLVNKSTLSLSSSSSGSLIEEEQDLRISIDKRKPLPPIPVRPQSQTGSKPANSEQGTLRPPGVVRPRPVSMYQTSESKFDDVPIEDREQLKQILTGLSQRSSTVILDNDNHIDSNVDFLKTLDKVNTGRSFVSSSRTGDRNNIGRSASASASRHSKKSSISSIKGIINDKFSRKTESPSPREPAKANDMGPPRTVSGGTQPHRTQDKSFSNSRQTSDSWNEQGALPSRNSTESSRGPYNSYQFSRSTEDFKEPMEVGNRNGEKEKKHHWHRSGSRTRNSNIQSRMQQLLEGDSNPPKKTASGYGKYTDVDLSAPSKTSPPLSRRERGSSDDDGYSRREDRSKSRDVKPERDDYDDEERTDRHHREQRQTNSVSPKPHSYRSMGVLRDGYIPSYKNHTRKLSAVSSTSSSSGSGSTGKRPPAKPPKPSHLQSPKRQTTSWTGGRDNSRQKRISADIGSDWEKQFNQKYPSLG